MDKPREIKKRSDLDKETLIFAAGYLAEKADSDKFLTAAIRANAALGMVTPDGFKFGFTCGMLAASAHLEFMAGVRRGSDGKKIN